MSFFSLVDSRFYIDYIDDIREEENILYRAQSGLIRGQAEKRKGKCMWGYAPSILYAYMKTTICNPAYKNNVLNINHTKRF